MSEITQSAHPDQRSGMGKRNLIILGSIIPIAALFGLLGWAVARSDGIPGGLVTNTRFGEIAVDQRPAPEFASEALDGESISLSGLRGKVVMLDFWSSWCGPCRREAPALAEVYSEYEGKNVEFIGIAIWDNPGNVAGHVQEFDLSYPNLIDDKGLIGIDYGVAGIPEKFFIDGDGDLVRKFVGPIQADTLRAALDRLLQTE